MSEFIYTINNNATLRIKGSSNSFEYEIVRFILIFEHTQVWISGEGRGVRESTRKKIEANGVLAVESVKALVKPVVEGFFTTETI